MRIALVHTRLVRRGGLETRLITYVHELCARGHEVSVIVGKVDAGIPLPAGARILRVDMRLIPKPARELLFDPMVRRVVGRHDFDFVLSLARTSRQDAVLAAGNHLGYIAATGRRRQLGDLLTIELERRAFAASGTILANSRLTRDELVDLYRIRNDKIRVLWPPTDPRRFHQGLKARKAELRRKYGFHPGKKTFAFVSASHFRKGLPLLLETFRALAGDAVELAVAGVRPPDVALGNVKYLGFIDTAEEVFAAADFSLLPALYEPFGQVVTESILCGTPVLVSHRVGAREILSEREGRVVTSFSPEAWVGAIRRVVGEEFSISPDFAFQKRIRPEDHVDAILEIAGSVPGRAQPPASRKPLSAARGAGPG